MYTYYIVTFFIFGLVFGSFFNVVGLRVPRKIPFSTGRSYCPSCKHELTSRELIPLISYVFQRGRCRTCHVKIPVMYPLIEILTAVLFAFSYYKLGFTRELLIALLLVSMLIIILVADVNYMVIPNKILLFFLPLFIMFRVIQPLHPWYSSILGAGIGFGLVALIIIVSKGGMGGGDMKLFGVLGIVLGLSHVLLAFFLSALLGAVIGGVLLIGKKIERKQPIPFGPYIVVAALTTYFYGTELLTWYFSLIG